MTDAPTKLIEVTCNGLPIGVPSSRIVSPCIPVYPIPRLLVEYEINSTVSPPKQASFSDTVAESIAVNSSSDKRTPLIKTSSNPTLYVTLNVVAPTPAIFLSTVLSLGIPVQDTPLPVETKYCPDAPRLLPAVILPLITILLTVETPVTMEFVAPIPPLTCRVYCGTVVPIPTLFVSGSATIRLVSTSNPCRMTKFF